MKSDLISQKWIDAGDIMKARVAPSFPSTEHTHMHTQNGNNQK